MRAGKDPPFSGRLGTLPRLMLIRIADLLTQRARSIVLVLALLAGTFAAAWGWAVPIDDGIDGFRHTLFKKPPSGETVIVEIDAPSLSELQDWPWPRSLHGRLIDRLNEAGAERIVMDVVFATPSADPAQDRALAAALERAEGRVTLAAMLQHADGSNGEPVSLPPTAQLSARAQVGAIWVPLDDNFEVRNVPYGVVVAGARRPSLAAVLAGNESASTDHFPVDWSFDWSAFPRISYADVLAGRFDRSFFTGKNVLVGVTHGLGDVVVAPTHGRISGLYVQAVGSETLRRHDPVPLGHWPAFAVVAILIAVATALRRPFHRSAAFAGVALAAAAGPMLLREYTGYILDPGAGVAAALAAVLLSITAAITAAVLARVTLSPVSHLPNLTAMCMTAPEAAITVAVRLRNHVETTALLGPEVQGELLRKVFDRLTLAAAESAVFQVDDHSFAWRTTRPLAATMDTIEGLHALLASGISIGERAVDVTVAIGISDDPSLDTESAVTAAMAAASRAERRGLNWERYESDDDDDANWRLSLLNELDRAIDHGDVWVAYQPKVDLKSRAVCGAEALVRWSHAVRGEIRPDQFIPTLEDNGRIEKLTLHVLKSAINDFAKLEGDLSVAINISARMIGRNRLLEPIRWMLTQSGMDASRLTLEITESAALAGSAGIEELNSLRALGVHISIDDYGTGQSTLSYLKMLPATELKIDRSFVQLIATNRSDAAVVDSTVKLAHALGLKVVAEGVESEEVLAQLRQMNCDMIQGYLVGEPARFDQFAARLRGRRDLRVVA